MDAYENEGQQKLSNSNNSESRIQKVCLPPRKGVNIPITNTKNEVRVKRTGRASKGNYNLLESFDQTHTKRNVCFQECNNIGKI